MLKIQLIRHGTLTIYLDNKKILVDPVLSNMGSIAPFPNVPNQNFNPLVNLPVNIDTIINCDAVLVTHTHRDHFDDAAIKLLSKDVSIFCQPQDETKIKSYGFINVYPINNSYRWGNITFNRTNGEHGHGELAMQMAPVSGFIISCNEEPSVYIAGDTVWCEEVEKSIQKYNPEIVVCNCGAAQFSYGEPITMTPEDIKNLCCRFPNVTVVAVHMEAWNHCRVSRKDLSYYVHANDIRNSIFIPKDGELLNF